MKSRLMLFPALFAVSFIAGAQKGNVESATLPVPIVVDANFNEWKGDWKTDKLGKILYDVANDKDNLYVRMKVTDDLTQRKIGLFGFTVYLNPKGKKVGKLGLKYPVAKNMDELKKAVPKTNPTRAEQEDLKRDLVKDEQVLELVGLAKENITSSRLGLMNGIECIIKADSMGAFVYEAKIPFKAFRIDKSAVKTLGVGLVSGKMPVQSTAPNMTPAGGGPGNIGYVPRSMGGYGSGYGGYGGTGRSSSSSYSEWNSSTSLIVGVTLK